MSKFTKFLVPFLLIALLFAQMLPMQAAAADTLPEIPLSLHGLFNEEGRPDTQHLITIGMKDNKGYLEYRGNPSLEFNNVVCMLDREYNLMTYYLGEDNRIYVEDDQDHRFVEPAYTLEEHIVDWAAAPIAGQVDNDCAIAISNDYFNNLVLLSLSGGVEDRIMLPFYEDTDLAAIAARYIGEYEAEYYILDRSGAIWNVVIEINEQLNRMTVTKCEKVLEAGTFVSSVKGFYFDGELIYGTFYTENGSALIAVNPDTKIVYNYGVIEEGVFIWGLYESGEMAPNCDEDPLPYEYYMDTTFNGLYLKENQSEEGLVTIRTKGMRHTEQPVEVVNDDLPYDFVDVICQLNAENEIETYFIRQDRAILIEDEQNQSKLIKMPYKLESKHLGFAPGPLNYQNTDGWCVGISDTGLALTLTNLFTGEDEKDIDLMGLLGWPDNARPMTVAAIAARSLVGSEAEYYLLDMDGMIWSATISFPDFELIDLKEVEDTCEYASTTDGFYFDGTWLFRTYWDNNRNASVVMAYNPETEVIYDLGTVGYGMMVNCLYEAGKIPTAEHAWQFQGFTWEKNDGYKAYAIYECPICCEERLVEAEVTKIPTALPQYKAKVTAKNSLDGVEHTETKRVTKSEVVGKSDLKKEFKPVKPLDPKPITLHP